MRKRPAGRMLRLIDSLAADPARAFLLAALWPFVYFSPHILPVVPFGRFLRIGSDFDVLYFKYKVYLLDCLSRGHLPLWSPSEGAGFPFLASPFTQSLYPLNLPLALWYRAAGGWSAVDHHVFTVAGVAIFAAGLWRWLRLFPLSPRAALFAALLVPVSFKMSEILRFPNAVHTAAWYPWILWAMTRISLAGRPREMARPAAVLAFATACLATGGYPYFAYYGIFLFIPYLLLLSVPALRRAFLPAARPARHAASLAAMAAAVALPALALLPYLRLAGAMLARTTDRGGDSFRFSTSHVFSPADTLGSLLFPPLAQAEGWYFFGVAGFLVVVLYLATPVRAPGGGAPADGMPRHRTIKAALLCFAAAVSLVTYGKGSPLFALLWRYFPGFSSLRVWGRMNVVLLPAIALMLGFALTALEARMAEPDPAAREGWFRRAMRIVGAAWLLVLATQLATCAGGWYDGYWTRYFGKAPYQEAWFVAAGFLSFLLVLALCRSAMRRPLDAGRAGGWFAALLAASVLELAYTGLTTWSYPASWRAEAVRRDPGIVARVMPAALATPRTDGYRTIALGTEQSVGVVENWYFASYVAFRKRHDASSPATRLLLGMSDGRRLFVSRSIDHRDPEAFAADVLRTPQRIRIESYDGDELAARVDSPVDGYLSFIDNWDPGWTAAVDGRDVAVERLFGTFKAVPVARGAHAVSFAYRPFPARTRGPGAGRPAPGKAGAPPG